MKKQNPNLYNACVLLHVVGGVSMGKESKTVPLCVMHGNFNFIIY